MFLVILHVSKCIDTDEGTNDPDDKNHDHRKSVDIHIVIDSDVLAFGKLKPQL